MALIVRRDIAKPTTTNQAGPLARVPLPDHPDPPTVALDHVAETVGRPIIDDDHSHMRVGLGQHRFAARSNVTFIIVIINNDGDRDVLRTGSASQLPYRRLAAQLP